MKRVHFITSNSNQTKVEAIKNSLAKLPVSDFIFAPIECEQNDYRPTSYEEIGEALAERADKLFEKYDGSGPDVLVYKIEIQKGIHYFIDSDKAYLICVAHICDKNYSKSSWAEDIVEIPKKIWSLVQEGKDLYEAQNIVFGEEFIKNNISVYEHLTGKKEIDWFEEIVYKALLF